MLVKWKGLRSTVLLLPGGGPRGLGIEEYLSQSKNKVEFLDRSKKFKFIDDLSIVEIINLLGIGLASYKVHSHIHSGIGTENFSLPTENLKSQK